jgi:membrane-associated phospholipid phosphatase
MTVVDPTNLEGLVSFPSFHVAGGLMIVWAFRRHRLWCGAVAVLNAGLVASTVLSGAHYVIDVAATIAMCAGSVWLYQRWQPVTQVSVEPLDESVARAA